MLKLRKNLRDSFAMALEEMENVVGGEIVGQTDEEIKILEEEAVKQGVEIQQDIAAIEECCADIETLQEQLGENDKKLTDPDIVVTAVDVEVSEECYKGMAFKYGVKNANAIRFSHESVLDAVKAEPRRYLAMSSESIKEIFVKIWEKIKAFFRKIGEKLGIVAKIKKKKMEDTVKKADDVYKNLSSMSPEELRKNVEEELKKAEGELRNLKASNESFSYSGFNKLSNMYPLLMLVLLSGDKGAIDELVDTNRAVGIVKDYINKTTKFKNAIKAKASADELYKIAETFNFERLYPKLGSWLVKYINLITTNDYSDMAKFKSSLSNGIISFNGGDRNIVITDIDTNSISTVKFYPSDRLKKFSDFLETFNVPCKLTGAQCKEIADKARKTQINNLMTVTMEVSKVATSFEQDMKSLANEVDKDLIDTLKLIVTMMNNVLLPIVGSIWTTNNIITLILENYVEVIRNKNYAIK